MNVATALSLLIAMLHEANALGAAIRQARAEGRQDLTDDEVATFAGRDDAARAKLQDKINALPQD